jgi:hypothetical protein
MSNISEIGSNKRKFEDITCFDSFEALFEASFAMSNSLLNLPSDSLLGLSFVSRFIPVAVESKQSNPITQPLSNLVTPQTLLKPVESELMPRAIISQAVPNTVESDLIAYSRNYEAKTRRTVADKERKYMTEEEEDNLLEKQREHRRKYQREYKAKRAKLAKLAKQPKQLVQSDQSDQRELD